MAKGLIKIALISVGLLLSNAYAAPDASTVLLRIEDKMSGVKTIEADFTQEKRLSVFSQPVIIKGKIFIQKPQLFSWHAQSPVRYSLLIKGDVITQWDQESNQVQQFFISRNPGFSIAVTQMNIWLFGAYTSLLKDYVVKVVSPEPVILEFIPEQFNPSSKLIKNVKLSFENDERYLKEIRIEEKNLDTTILTFSSVKLNLPINPSAWEINPDVR